MTSFKLTNRVRIIPVLLLWLFLPPFSLYLLPSLSIVSKISILSGIGLMCFSLVQRNKININVNRFFFQVLFLQFIYFLLVGVIFMAPSYFVLGLKLTFAILILMYVVNFDLTDTLCKTILFVGIVMGILGILCFFLVFLGVWSPVSTFTAADNRTAFNFLFTFSNAYLQFGSLRIVRIAGYFDEPGQLAMFTTMLLLLNKIRYDNKKYEFLLILTGAFTLSLAFYLSLLLYFFFFYVNIKRGKVIIVCTIVLSGVLYSLIPVMEDSPLYELTLGRFINGVNNGFISGDNRSGSFSQGVEIIGKEIPFFGFSVEKLRALYPAYDASSVIGSIIIYGFLGFIILHAHFIFYLFHFASLYAKTNFSFKSVNFLAVFSIVGINIIQRGIFNRSLYIVLFFLLILSLKQILENEKKPNLNYNSLLQ
jgi:hypothetical protein